MPFLERVAIGFLVVGMGCILHFLFILCYMVVFVGFILYLFQFFLGTLVNFWCHPKMKHQKHEDKSLPPHEKRNRLAFDTMNHHQQTWILQMKMKEQHYGNNVSRLEKIVTWLVNRLAMFHKINEELQHNKLNCNTILRRKTLI